MRAVAAIPAIGLLAGCAIGLAAPGTRAWLEAFAMPLCAAIGVAAWLAGQPRVFAVASGLAFAAGGALLAADAWQRAWRPPLRAVFDQAARVQRAEALG